MSPGSADHDSRVAGETSPAIASMRRPSDGSPELAVLESKLAPPPPRQGTIHRTALVNRLRVGRTASISVVTAPLGYGKTTLLADWAHNDRRAFAWVSLDEHDNDPVTFLTYLAVALDRVEKIDPGVFAALASPGVSPDHLVALLCRSLLASTVPAVIVLDDTHLLTNWECLRAITSLVDHMPAHSQLALASRTDSPVPLARLRAEGRVVEVGADELRLGERDAARLLRAAGVDLAAVDVAELTQRTEGWPAGLYLAALSLRATGSPLSMLHGSDRFVSDYFRLEILANLSDSRIEFLTHVSVLDRMCGQLCDAVLETRGSAAALEELENSNLFVVPLDHARRWYRFHHLFRDMLRDELERREPAAAAMINARAADWCEANDDIAAAIEYADAAGDRERMLRLVVAAAAPMYWRGRFTTVERWLSRLDEVALLERNPAIAIFGADMLALLGRPDQAVRWADAAGRADPETPMPDGSTAGAWLAMVRSTLCCGSAEAMLADAELAAETIAPGSPWAANCHFYLGMATLSAGDEDRADACFSAAAAHGAAAGSAADVSLALAARSLLATARSEWAAAEAFANDARDTIRDASLEDYVTSALTFVAGARAALRRSDWVRAQADLDHATTLASQLTYAVPHLAVKVRLELARAHFSLGDFPAATELAAQIGNILDRRPGLGVLRTEWDELRQQLETGRRDDGGWESSLTPAELRLLPLLTTHLSFREIAEQLFVSRNTVKTQAISVYRKLGVSSRSEAIDRAVSLGLVASSGHTALD